MSIFQARIAQHVAPIKPAMCLRPGVLDKAQLLLLSTSHGAKMTDLSTQAEAAAAFDRSAVQEYRATF